MKKYLLFIAILIFSMLRTTCQSWQRVQLEAPGINTEGMISGNIFGDTVIIMGSNGKTFYSTNFFQSYTVDSTYYGNQLEAMEFVTRDTGYIETGELPFGLLITTNGGVSFHEPLSNIYNGMSGFDMIQFSHSDTGYVGAWIGDNINRVGMSSSYAFPIAPLPFNYSVVQMRVSNDSTIYLIYNQGEDYGIGGLYLTRSTNYGNSWQTLGKTGLDNIGDFRILDDSTIIVAGTAGIAKSTNGGDSFHIVLRSSNTYIMVNINSVYFPSHDTGFVVLGGETIYRTYDAGDSWIETDFALDSVDIQGNGVEFITASSSQKIIVGCSSGAIYKTDNGGGISTRITNIIPLCNYTLYPNPTNGPLKITPPVNNGGVYSVEITNVLGQIVYKGYANNNQIDVSSLAAGIYLFKLAANGVSQTAKFVKSGP